MTVKRFRLRVLSFISGQLSPWLVAVLAFLVGGALTVMLAVADNALYQRQLRQRFDMLAAERFSRLQERLDRQVTRLDTLSRFFIFSRQVEPSEFDGFVAPLLLGTQAYAWNPKVSRTERAAFEAQARKEGLTDYAIRELDENGALKIADVRDEYFPVRFIQTLGKVPPPLGLDIASEPVRHSAIERARLLKHIVATPRIRLLALDPSDIYGILLVAPVFSVSSPSSELKGYVTAIISLAQLMNVGTVEQDNLSVTMQDLSSPAKPEQVYQSPVAAINNQLYASSLLSLGDRDYLVEVRPTQIFSQSNQIVMPGRVMWLGGLLSLMLSALLYSLISQRQRALQRVAQRTRELRQRELQLRAAHGQLRNVLDAATEVAIIATDLDGLINTFNVGAQKMLGYAQEDVLGKFRLMDLYQSAELELRAGSLSRELGRPVSASQLMFLDAVQEGSHPSQEWTLQRSDGSTLVVDMLVTAVRDDQGLWTGYLAVCLDVTEHKRVNEALAEQGELLKKLGSQVPGGIYQYHLGVDGSAHFRYASAGMSELFEVDEAQLLEDSDAVLRRIHPTDLVRVKSSILASARHLTAWSEEYRVELPSKGQRWLRAASTPERLADGSVLWHGFVSDITDLKRVEQELRELSVTDVLTGAYNRRYFQDRMQAELKRVDRHGGHLSIIMLDIDHFKRINDRFGHAAGDQVLKAISEKISHRLRSDDVFCRLGGEEFMVVCPGTRGAQAYQLALSLREELRNQVIEGVDHVVTASFGIASLRAGEGIDAMLLRADSGVYAAKQAGRDRVEPEQP
ncbi:CHASE domain-containing protein/sensory box histidine kinase [Pseudomonas coronafaciens pv. garcae]|uniref:diguanylate cyclase n=2 Tax=Pseudomonas syringae group TaxID=136849 RepID=A0AB37QIT0_9PSED|nr:MULTISPECIES: diguanylate cyclase [Pseudomonas syringae group]KPB51324.1 CHASE domain-containing protein/sensory box histidine kinase [Pseudomonas coronafaciens pv. oryzae]KPY06361.1 CHASE domain-containing protein/sensory box histidine kinase [Pseudomonas coronafaciens pv. oryzae]MCQ2992278.1 diguanylate cyclase [Pseudomonas tremae]RMR95301.1 CHASE domain-containing protein/sensory box histidine kinase [Pseudomonas coronafaciens pv. garcae]RMS09125.1 CHASE domain-containing protein/sensory